MGEENNEDKEDAEGKGNDEENPLTLRGGLRRVVRSLLNNPLKSTAAIAVFVGFLFQLAFWSSINDMPELDLEGLTMAFFSSALIGLLFLAWTLVPVFMPAAVWSGMRDEWKKAAEGMGLTEVDKQPWQGTLNRAAGSGLAAVGYIVASSYLKWPIYPVWFLLVLGILLVLRKAQRSAGWSGWGHKRGSADPEDRFLKALEFIYLSAVVVFAGFCIVVPVGALALLVGRGGGTPGVQMVTFAGYSLLLLTINYVVAFRSYTLDRYISIVATAVMICLVVIFAPLKVYQYISQAVASQLGQGATRNITLSVTKQQCLQIGALTYPSACVITGDFGKTIPMGLLSREGPEYVVEIFAANARVPEGGKSAGFKLHIKKDGTGAISAEPIEETSILRP